MEQPINASIAAVETKEQLLAVLRATDITVPDRTDGQTKHHTERWMICRLLATLAKRECLSFPLSVTHRSCPRGVEGGPDFFVYEGGRRISVEMTEAIPPQKAEAYKLAEELPDCRLIDEGLFRPGAPKLTKNEMKRHLQNNRVTSSGWAGDQVEEEWARLMMESINKKLTKLRQPLFERSDVDWLVIYDNLPQAALDLNLAMKLLLLKLMGCWADSDCFHNIFIEHGLTIVRIVSPVEFLPLNDLWHDPEDGRR